MNFRKSPLRWLALFLLPVAFQTSPAIDRSVTQLIVSIAPDWDASVGKLQLFERTSAGWQAVSQPFRVIYGKNGLAWGRGLLGSESGVQKVEHDKRAPAGLFKIGTIYTYDSALPAGANYPFHTMTEADAWIDDPALPHYNQHITVDPANPPPWFAKQKMKLGDPPHRWMIEIRHNADPPVPGDGSAIFFHIQRGPDRPSAGCTVMPQASLLEIVRWLRADRHPEYLLLPREEYLKRWKAWGLPSPQQAAGVL